MTPTPSPFLITTHTAFLRARSMRFASCSNFVARCFFLTVTSSGSFRRAASPLPAGGAHADRGESSSSVTSSAGPPPPASPPDVAGGQVVQQRPARYPACAAQLVVGDLAGGHQRVERATAQRRDALGLPDADE